MAWTNTYLMLDRNTNKPCFTSDGNVVWFRIRLGDIPIQVKMDGSNQAFILPSGSSSPNYNVPANSLSNTFSFNFNRGLLTDPNSTFGNVQGADTVVHYAYGNSVTVVPNSGHESVGNLVVKPCLTFQFADLVVYSSSTHLWRVAFDCKYFLTTGEYNSGTQYCTVYKRITYYTTRKYSFGGSVTPATDTTTQSGSFPASLVLTTDGFTASAG